MIALGLPAVAASQSTDQNFPTPVTTNEITGTIKARDLGDSRLTSYYYAFEGGQGDIFINLVTKNFSGDIDVFNSEGLRPLTKMVIYADSPVSETGRLIYLRKGERLILRVEGRSPNDDPATFRLKFGGSFIALAERKPEEIPTIVRSETDSGVRVNSVGTILPAIPKHLPPTKTTRGLPVESSPDASAEAPKVVPDKTGTDSLPGDKSAVEPMPGNKSATVRVKPLKKPVSQRPPRRTSTGRVVTPPAKTTKASVLVEKTPDPLANIRLMIQLKDGEEVERPMSEVLRFSVDKGILTVIAKDGKISRFSILDVAKVTIE